MVNIKMPTTNKRNTIDRIKRINDLFESLSKVAFMVEETPFQNFLKGLVKPYDSKVAKNQWTRFLHFAYRLYFPFRTNSFQDLLARIGSFIVVGSIQSMFTLLGVFFCFFAAGNFKMIAVPATPADLSATITFCLLLGLQVLLIIFGFWRGIYLFIRRNNYTWWYRFIILLGLIGVLGYVISWPVSLGFNKSIAIWQLWRAYQLNWDKALIAVVFLIPSVTFYYMNIIDLVVWLLWLMPQILRTIGYFYDPFPKELLERLALKEIMGAEDKSWRLTNLSRTELETLKKLAMTNREGTDKRLVPTVIILGILQIVGWGWFARLLGPFLTATLRYIVSNSLPSPIQIIVGIMIGFVLILAFVLLSSFARLFSNLVAQSMIIEVCVVIEYGKQSNSSSRSRRSQKAKE